MKLREVVLSAVFPCCLLMNTAAQTSSSGSVSSRPSASADVVLLPTPTGPYRVGRAGFHRVDASRPETFTADATDNRQVLFQIWYPAEPTGGTLSPYIADLLPDNRSEERRVGKECR